LTLALAANALAVSGTQINVGTPFESGPPSVAVDSAGTAYIAWANQKDLAPVTTNIVQYCVLPANATGCSHAGNLIPADGGERIDGVHVLVEGSTIVVLADVFGTAGGSAQKYEPEQEWQSTDGGATFAIVDGGLSVASGILSADTEPVDAVTVPGTGTLGFGWVTAGDVPTFNAFPLSSPPECSVEKCSAGFASLEPNTNPDVITNPAGADFASETGASPGILALFPTDFSNGPLGCLVGFGTAYAYGSGEQSSTNNYNISPGTPNSAWRVAAAEADCDVEYSSVGGGPSGFGVLEDNAADTDIVYDRFDAATESFDTPEATIASSQGEQDPAVSQDGSGGVYTTFLLGGAGGPISLAYSGDGGTSWIGPAAINANTDGGASEVTSSVGPTGQGWAAWLDNGSVYAQQFVAADATTAPASTSLTTAQSSGATTGPLITITAGTVGETDRATLSGANAATAGGTVTYDLYSNSTCTTLLSSGGAATVTGGAAGSSAPVTTALAPGTYYWRAAYGGDARNAPSASACGSEVLTVTPAVEIEGSGSSSGKSVTITVSCPSAEPCTVTITVTATEITIVVKKASAARKIVHKRTITLATGKFTIPGKSTKKLKLNLTKAGKRLLKREHGHLKANVRVSDKTPGGLELTTRTLAIHTVKPKHKK
jgi:hypothetical protein